jgi:hypothetical protein
MAEQKALVTLKDGTKITVDDLSQLSQYSDREDMESITFFGDEEASVISAADAGTAKSADAGVVTQTVATVEQPKADPVVPNPQPAADHSAAITAMVGALAGAVSSAGMPALTNLVKNLIKSKLKGKKGGEQKEETEEPTDCKTHQLKSNAKMVKMSARISVLENKTSNESKLFNADNNPLEDLEERIEKLEKHLKTKGKKK